jgi:adenosylhomocysteine nucleosidase
MEQKIGIMGAMPEEIKGVIALLSGCREHSTGKRTYFTGSINGINTVVVFSRWGKVAAAATAATLIHKFNVTELIFTGVAGAIHSGLHTGDIVIAKRLVQHDLDARPLIKQFEIPLLNRIYIESDSNLLAKAVRAVEGIIGNNSIYKVIGTKEMEEFRISKPKLFIGDVASGDSFFYETRQKKILQSVLPDVLCVEMEGAAVAQVCYESDIPFAVIRTISDDADEHSPMSFTAFVKKIASTYSAEIIKNIYHQMS